ncbi:MAG TPA: DUF5808 domain-containing protein [Gaiellaceae bacterium]|jgi:hypothetical protein|nr:DUF5808 domain-containing protein [Gaiellaceae bacterium]
MDAKKRTGLLIGAGLIGAAVATELSKPSDKRTWHGRILGFVPYDFRPPTVERIKSRMWNPNDPRVLTPRAFGVGWDVNWAQLLG